MKNSSLFWLYNFEETDKHVLHNVDKEMLKMYIDWIMLVVFILKYL